MGFLDFLFGPSGRYSRLLGWAEHRVGKVTPPMNDMQIDSYVFSLRTAAPKISQNTLTGFKAYLKEKYGQKQQ